LSSIIYFSVILLCSWESLAITFQFALLNGGTSALVYGCIFVGFGATAVACSFAEMASMYAQSRSQGHAYFTDTLQRPGDRGAVSMVH
jgi:hypothetical protein